MTIAVHTGTCRNLYFHRMTWVDLSGERVVPTHKHTYGHVMCCHAGRAEIWAQGGEAMVMVPGDKFDVPPGIAHDVTGLEPGTVIECVHVMHLEDGTEMPFSYQPTPREVMQITARM